MSRIVLCGNGCGHSHESLNGPTGCCAEHGPYMYFCGECHDRRATPAPPCPTCGPTSTEQHPRREGVTRCANCKEWLTAPTTPSTDAAEAAGDEDR